MNRRTAALAVAITSLGFSSLAARAEPPPSQQKRTWSFEEGTAGQAPKGFAFLKSESGKAGRWLVQPMGDAPDGKQVLVQTDSDNSEDRFLLAVPDAPSPRDVRVAVRCKPMQGKTDQACGLVFRLQDASNYYITRANPLEGNVRLYTVKNGRRTQLASWSGKVTANAWHELRAEAQGDSLRVFWDGQQVLEKSDATFPQAGKVGLWTKADSVTAFDALTVMALGQTEPAVGGGGTLGLDTADIERRTGAKGELSADEGVFKVNLPRSDLKVRAAGVKLTPPLGLTAWAAFKRTGDATMMMGDIVLLEDQVNPVMDVALQNGLEVTALHNHFFWDSPKVMFMHIGGMGETAKLADAVGKVFARLRETAGGKGRVPRASIDPAKSQLYPPRLDGVLGQKGTYKDGVYKVVVGRTVRMHGHEMGKAMGVNTWAAFAGDMKQAVVDGDFAMLESELQPVLKALRAANIDIVAIHNHMTGEEPRMLFLHYWGVGPAEQLARGVRSALDITAAPVDPKVP